MHQPGVRHATPDGIVQSLQHERAIDVRAHRGAITLCRFVTITLETLAFDRTLGSLALGSDAFDDDPIARARVDLLGRSYAAVGETLETKPEILCPEPDKPAQEAGDFCRGYLRGARMHEWQHGHRRRGVDHHAARASRQLRGRAAGSRKRVDASESAAGAS